MELEQDQLDGLLDELEAVFTRCIRTQELGHIPNIIEFKNMLTLAANNAR